ncbi:MAG: FHA domain-containing protein [Isosphaeraceae bacterium]|nr:FHA domain-containing protein [Isosphaeraceae bacterium]
MKVQLIVVQGKPEGKTIPLLGPRFKIGRGETCHLRPNSELVSREHAEFSVVGETVSVKDLGSRNGTLLNGKALTGESTLKDGDLVQVGPLTFAVSIQGVTASPKPATAPTPPAQAPAAAAAASLDDISGDDIDSWLGNEGPASGAKDDSSVYGGDTITISAFKAAAIPTEDNDEEYERLSDDAGSESGSDDESSDDEEGEEASLDEMPEEFIDESNPFYVKKKKEADEPAKSGKPVYTDTSDAAKDILSKLLERRRNAKSS